MTDSPDTTKAPEGGLGPLRPSDCVPGCDGRATVRVFLDCDGVLADFDTYAHNYFGMNPREYEKMVGSAAFWAELEAKGDFYRNLPLMPDAMSLYEGVKHLSPVILTGCPRGNWAEAQKVAWAAEHFPGVPVITCRSSDKRAHAKPGDVLIDDWHQHRHRWVEMGGVWISHTCAETSLAALWAHYPHLHPKAQPGTEKPSGFAVDHENHEALRKALEQILKVTGMTPLDVISHQRGIAHRALEALATLNRSRPLPPSALDAFQSGGR